MPRDISGNYTLPPINPVAPQTIIESDWANTTCDDIAAALTDSLSRTGSGGMLVPFRNADGVQANPGMTWVNEPTSGWYRAGLNDFWYSVGGLNIFRITAAGIELAPGKTAINISSFTNVQDVQPVVMKQGEQWFESDTGGFYMRYVNPDTTQTLVALAAAGGDFVPLVGGKIPPQFIPAGGVIQMATGTDPGGAAHSQTVLFGMTTVAQGFVPKSANSKIRIDCQFFMTLLGAAGVSNFAAFRLFDFTNGVDIPAGVGLDTFVGAQTITTNQGMNVFASVVLSAIVPNAALIPRNFTVRGRVSLASSNVQAANQIWTFTEIQN